MNWDYFLPAVDKQYKGAKISIYFLILVTIAGTIRSLIHILAPDGGAYSIAGINIEVEAGNNIVAMFGQWGASQLILALIFWLVIIRYRFLVPAMIGVVFLEQVLRIAAGQLKPVMVAAPPPGEIGSYILIPLSVIFFLMSIRRQEYLTTKSTKQHEER
jgi:hypothetical protein